MIIIIMTIKQILNQPKWPLDILQDLFDYEDTHERKGHAFVWLCFKGTHGCKFGAFRMLKKSTFDSHKTKVTQLIDGHIRVEILDVWFDPDLGTTVPELRG